MNEEKEKNSFSRDELNEKLEEILLLVKENKDEIHFIRRYMRRIFVTKLIYWAVIIIITAGAVYAARPYAKKAIESYHSMKGTIEKASNAVEEPSRLFQDVKLLKKIFELNSK